MFYASEDTLLTRTALHRARARTIYTQATSPLPAIRYTHKTYAVFRYAQSSQTTKQETNIHTERQVGGERGGYRLSVAAWFCALVQYEAETHSTLEASPEINAHLHCECVLVETCVFVVARRDGGKSTTILTMPWCRFRWWF